MPSTLLPRLTLQTLSTLHDPAQAGLSETPLSLTLAHTPIFLDFKERLQLLLPLCSDSIVSPLVQFSDYLFS